MGSVESPRPVRSAAKWLVAAIWLALLLALVAATGTASRPVEHHAGHSHLEHHGDPDGEHHGDPDSEHHGDPDGADRSDKHRRSYVHRHAPSHSHGELAVADEPDGVQPPREAPPFFSRGTVYTMPELLLDSDTSHYTGSVYVGMDFDKVVWDVRDGRAGWVTVDVFVFELAFSSGHSATLWANEEYGSPAAAQIEVDQLGRALGQLPTSMLPTVETIAMHQFGFGAGANRSSSVGNINVNGGLLRSTIAEGTLDTLLLHEIAHLAIDPIMDRAAWGVAQGQDDIFPSPYAEQWPEREDVAETFVPYMASRLYPERFEASLIADIDAAFPARFRILDDMNLDLTSAHRVGRVVADADCNQAINLADALAIAQYVAAMRSGATVCMGQTMTSQVALQNADLDGDRAVTSADAQVLLNCLAGGTNCAVLD